jgi:hypothetical protein
VVVNPNYLMIYYIAKIFQKSRCLTVILLLTASRRIKVASDKCCALKNVTTLKIYSSLGFSGFFSSILFKRLIIKNWIRVNTNAIKSSEPIDNKKKFVI